MNCRILGSMTTRFPFQTSRISFLGSSQNAASTLQPPWFRRLAWGAALVVSLLSAGCYRNVFGSEYETCDEVNAAIKEELSGLQACMVDADCGQVLEGTSCGCTNDLVAHKDHDAARLRGLQARADELKCEMPLTDCSCPAADGFVCTQGVCGWKYLQ